MEAAAVLTHIIRSRRSVKPPQFDADQPVPDEVIKEALVNATWAPNHGKTEPWHFVVFTGKAIQRLIDFQMESYRSTAGDSFNEGKYQKIQTNYSRASHVIAICHKRNPQSRILELEEIEAVATAVQNLALTIHAYGYGGYWTTGGVTYNESAKSFFELDAADKLLGFYLVGAVIPESVTSGKRMPIEDKMSWLTH